MTVSNEPDYAKVTFTYSKVMIKRELPMLTDAQFEAAVNALVARMAEDAKAAIVASYPPYVAPSSDMANHLWEQNWYDKMRRWADGPRPFNQGYGYVMPPC